MSLHPRLSCSLLAASLLLAGCSSGPPIDYRTGKPMMAGPWENRDLSLEYFQLDFLGQYTVKHAFINGINIDRCYPGAPPDHVQVVMMTTPTGFTTPGIVKEIANRPPEPYSQSAAFIGSQYSNTSNKYQPDGTVLRNPDGTPQKKVVKGWEFNALCSAEFAGGNYIGFGIRSAASQSIEEKIQSALSRISAPDRDYKSNRFLDAPRTETRWGNTWTWYRALIPTPVGDGVEMWMTPIGNTGYYITVYLNFIEAARQKNTEDYQRARKLMDGILQSVVIQKQ
ncbi:DUF769 domain-containing protein [Xylella fastidiosa subsp. multiplex]|uniref:DUF769 domain-containing protein n=3 Tax=Xylella fastidiosa TaxID=2371 RepID=UPI0014635397|nr:DUF769 domain-containing protein [Xylella fastidiosa]MDC6412488.1 DUF769 domain-containing protein [Xylella fastidiosa subsp. multiplex]MDD0866519.1 DUF769 domain-containing protein [Xylella fastidiosa subsp. multiplex]MDD0925923.1 DUF769 domain-containing protein [Xylella fastidiosa subsp. multiplex]MDD0932537.1 DUF769 domain-containing protein [Xylella fastidiosa subsp. multiplex]QJP57059.1 DUF769 domain-containing protein [Xylella fastidiosa subsp. multiplex]